MIIQNFSSFLISFFLIINNKICEYYILQIVFYLAILSLN